VLDIKKLESTRKKIYETFPARRDANMNLLDAISAYGHKANSVVELSESPHFEREYSSITDAISNGLPTTPWNKTQQIVYNAIHTRKQRTVVVIDATPQSRQFATTLSDRHIVHSANPAPGNKPICVGHQYSVLSYLPAYADRQDTAWLVPLDSRPVSSNEKGHEVGMIQVQDFIKNASLNDHLVVSVADSAYGSDVCREAVAGYPNWVSIFRLISTRNIYSIAEDDKSTAGNKKRYDEKMKLNDTATHRPANSIIEFSWTTRGGNHHTIKVELWLDQIIRGNKTYKGYEHPMTVARITAFDEAGKPIYKCPLWIAVLGDRRTEISAFEIFDYYLSRYDIEHFFRFGKDKLLLDAYQTPEAEHEENWWRLSSLAYVQLYLARMLVPLLPKKWERYLPTYKNKSKSSIVDIATPAQTQRGFSEVLSNVQRLATPPKPRGNPLGRNVGDTQPKRKKHKIVFKGEKKKNKTANAIISGSGKSPTLPQPQKIGDLVQIVQSTLKKISSTTDTFIDLLKKAA
jgi:hypothetical protein